MNTQNNGYNSNANTNTTNPIANINQINQAISLTKPAHTRVLDQGDDNPTNPSILADSTNHQSNSTDLALALSLSKSNNLDEILPSDLSDLPNSHNVAIAKSSENKDSEDTHNSNKKGKKAKLLTTKSEALESEQVMISFPISTKEKKQIEAVAILSGYESVDEFIGKIVSQGMKPYLDAVSQALNKDKA